MKIVKKFRAKAKYWGDKEAVERLKEFFDENFVCITSQIVPSEQGGYHGYATVEVGVE